MKRLFLALGLCLLSGLFFSCTQTGNDSVAGFSKEIRADDPVTIRLYDTYNLNDDAQTVEAARKAISVSPHFDFDVQVVDGQTLCLYPSQRLDYNTTYKVTADFGKLAGNSTGKRTYAVNTLAPVIRFEFSPLMSDGQDRYKVELEIESSDPLEDKYLESGISVKGSDASVQWTHSPDGLTHSASISGIKAGMTRYTLEILGDYPRYAAEAARRVQVPAIGTFEVVEATVKNEPFGFEVAFSAPIDPKQDFRSIVSMPGAGKLSFIARDNVLRITPATRAEEKQFLSVAGSLAGAGGQKLGEDFETWFSIPSGEPMVKFINKGTVLPSSGDMNLAFQAINYAKVRVRVKRIYENNVLQFLQSNRLNEADSYTGDVARTVLDTTLVLGESNSAKLRNLNTYGLHVADLIKVQRGAIYKLEIRGVDPLAEFKDEYHYESDYWFGSYSDYGNRSRNLLVSDLSVIAKHSDKGEYTVFVTDIISAQPVSGAKVTLYNDVNQPIAEGTTGSGGKFTCNVPDDEARTAIISKGDDKSYLSFAYGSALSMSSFEVDGNASRQGQKGFIFGERGVWRPGDDVHIVFISMLDEGVLPAGHPVTAVLRNPQGQTITTLVNNNGFDGMYAFNFPTSPDAPTGNWEVSVTAGGQTWSKTVKIEAVKPNNIVIDLKLNDKPAVPAKNVQGSISARWLVGNPARDLETRVEVELLRGRTSFEKYKDYRFEDASRQFYAGDPKEIFRGKTDGEGKLSFRASIGDAGRVPGMLTARFTTRVFEKGGDFSIDRMTTTVSPYNTYIGIAVPEEESEWGEDFLDKAKKNTIRLAAVDASGKPVGGNVKTEVEIYKMGWNWWWSSSSDGLASYAKDGYNEPFKLLNVNVNNGAGEFLLDLTKEESGFWLIRVTDLAGGHAASRVVLVRNSYENVGDDNTDAAIRLPMSLDRDHYVVGQTAKLTIPSASGARALVSIEKGQRVLKTFWVDCKGEKTEISIPIEDGMAPNVYATVSLVQPYNRPDNDAPIRLFGVQRIMVEEPATHLKPVIGIADEIRPESEVSFTVKEESGRPMSYIVALVDEGLLSLTRFKTPDPWSYFYATEALGVRTWDLFDLVIGAYGARMEQLFAIGGDGEGDTPVSPNTRAERFKPVSIVLGPYTVKAKGTEKHTVNMPPYIGRLRAMVIATDGQHMGSAEKPVMVTKPVMVKATLPRVVGTEEEIVLPVTVFTNKDGVGQVSVEVSAEGALSVTGDSKATVNAPKAGEELAFFTLKSDGTAGLGKVKCTVKGGGDSSSETVELDVRESNPRVTNAVVKLVEGGKTINLPFALAGRPGTNEVVVEASTIPPIDLEYRMGYLTRYPHGCLEQTVSAVFPQLYLGDMTELTAEERTNGETRIKAALNRLSAFAIPSGGMTTWPGTSAYLGSDVWATIYATHFMLEAQKAGYAVPASLKKSNLSYLKTVAQGKSYAAVSRAYACYVLALAGQPDRGTMNRMREELLKMPATCTWLIAGAYALDGKKDVAGKLIGTASVTENIDHFSSTYDSEERVQAIAARIYNATGDAAGAFRCVERLAGWLNDREHYMSTQSTAWALCAVADYIKTHPTDGLNVTVKAGRSTSTLKGAKTFAQGSLAPGDGTSLDLEVTNSSKAPVYLVVSSSGIPEKGEEVARADGLRMVVTYTLPDGTTINPNDLEQGTDFIVNTYLTNTSASTDYTNLALTQIFPSGWEIRVDRIDGFYQDVRDDRVYSYLYLGRSSTVCVKTRITAAYKGRFYRPAFVCEPMYDATVGASLPGGWCTVR
ncbi:MAG: alpha-2-macroglobulin [Bacteroidales bacterium]|nr:alpha-2-macroglobulin [Bacteroidales bacterium]